MTTREATKEFRLAQWTQVIQHRADSGLSVKEFCKGNQISKDAYYYWQNQLRQKATYEISKAEDPDSIAPRGWMQLKPAAKASAATSATLDIEINGCLVKADGNTDPDFLIKICRLLRSSL